MAVEPKSSGRRVGGFAMTPPPCSAGHRPGPSRPWGPGCILAAVVLWAAPASGQAPPPVILTNGSNGVEAYDARAGSKVPWREITIVEGALDLIARGDAAKLAAVYTRRTELPGVHELGRQLGEELKRNQAGFDFPGLVTHNPAFWLAERELAPGDVTLPYLVSMLAILNRDRVTAARLLALAQAALPLTPTMRHGYARPEAMLLHVDQQLLTGIPRVGQMQTVEQCDHGLALLRARITQWSNRPGLLRALLELQARKVQLLTQDGEHLGLLDQPIGRQLELIPEDVAYLRTHDPILSAGLDATVRQWINRQTLSQQWSRWIELCDPAEPAELEASIVTFEDHGRPDLAWLAWRCKLANNPVSSLAERARWQGWSAKLLDARSAAYLERTTAANQRAGMALVVLPRDDFGAAWSGDQNIHPLLAVQVERNVALIDTALSIVRPGSNAEQSYRFKRANIMADIDAVESSRQDLRRIREMIGDSPTALMQPGIRIMESIKIIEVRLLDAERHFPEATQLYRELLRNPRLKDLAINYAGHLLMAGDLPGAHAQFRDYAQGHPADTYRCIMADLTARRLGGRETAILEAARLKVAPEAWPATGVRYLLGHLTEEQLLQEARRGTQFEIIQHECEASFWIAQVALAEGRTEDGIKWLHRCVATGFVAYVEYKVAQVELERLEPRPDPGKKAEPENSRGVITT